jgi:hypothetical protein
MLQAAYLNEHLDQPHAAFGTDALLAQLRSSGAMDVQKYSDHFMDLVRWRYRFLVPPPEVMKVLADRFKPNLPGKDLMDLAMYSQDCARDPGLFAGPEPVEPPIPMAFKFYQSWVGSIADFIIDLWQDKAYDEATATPLTVWSLTQLLPAVPIQLDYHLQTNAAAVTARFLIGRALIRSTTSASRSRANAAVRVIVKSLGLGAREYSRIVTGVIDAAEIE